MSIRSSSKAMNLAFALGAPALAMLAVAACSGGAEPESTSKATNNSTGGSNGGGQNGASGGQATSSAPGSCASPTIDLQFSPISGM